MIISDEVLHQANNHGDTSVPSHVASGSPSTVSRSGDDSPVQVGGAKGEKINQVRQFLLSRLKASGTDSPTASDNNNQVKVEKEEEEEEDCEGALTMDLTVHSRRESGEGDCGASPPSSSPSASSQGSSSREGTSTVDSPTPKAHRKCQYSPLPHHTDTSHWCNGCGDTPLSISTADSAYQSSSSPSANDSKPSLLKVHQRKQHTTAANKCCQSSRLPLATDMSSAISQDGQCIPILIVPSGTTANGNSPRLVGQSLM